MYLFGGIGIVMSFNSACTAQDNPLNRTIGLLHDTVKIYQILEQSEQLQKYSLDSAILYAQKALELSAAGHYPRATATALALTGYYYRKKGDYSKSIFFLKRAADTAEKYGGSSFVLNMYNNLGASYAEQGSYGMGALYLYKALRYIKEKDARKTEFYGSIYSSLGSIWLSLAERERALQYLDTAEKIFLQRKDTAAMTYIYMQKAKAFYKENTVWAKNNLLKSLHNARAQNQKLLELSSLTYLGTLYVEEDSLQKGFYYLNQALALSKQLPDYKGKILSHFYLAHAFYHTKEFSRADQYLEPVLDINAAGDLYNEVLKLEAQLHAAKGDYQKAYNYQRESIAFNDSILNSEKSKTTNILLEYEASAKDNELARKQLIIVQQESKIKQKNTRMNAGIISLVLVTVLIFFIFKSYRRKQQMAMLHLRQDRLTALMRGEEKERERIARELHDGIGSLISSAKMHLEHSSKTANAQHTYESALHLLDEAYRELRQTAHNLVPTHLLEQGFVHALEAYCKRISYPPDFLTECILFGNEPQLSQEQELSLYRIIQELIHNAWKHGQATEVIVHIHNHDYLNISIEDNGHSLKEEKQIEKGAGLGNIKERLALWGGKMEIDNRPGMGMTVYLHFNQISS